METRFPTIPVAIIGGTDQQRFDVAKGAWRNVYEQCGDVFMGGITLAPPTIGDDWTEFVSNVFVAYKEIERLRIELDGALMGEVGKDSIGALLFAAENPITQYVNMAVRVFELARAPQAKVLMGADGKPLSLDPGIVQQQKIAMATPAAQQFMFDTIQTFIGGVFLLEGTDHAVVELPNGSVEGSTEAMGQYVAQKTIEGLGYTYMKLDKDVDTAAKTLANYLIEQFGFPKKEDEDDEEATNNEDGVTDECGDPVTVEDLPSGD